MVLFENSHVIDKDEANDGQRCGERKLGGLWYICNRRHSTPVSTLDSF